MWSVGGEPDTPPGWTGAPVPPSSFHDGQHVAGVHRRAWHRRYLFHDPLFRRLDFVLHFHGFDYHDALAGFDFGIFCDQQTHDASGHRSQKFPGTLFVTASFITRAQGARVAQLYPEARGTDPQMEIGGSLLALYFVVTPIDQQG